jgi:hypothetical protein
VAAGHLPAALPAPAAFAGTGTGVAAAYQQAWLACRLIAARAGPAGLVRFYVAVGADPSGAVAPALRAVLHESVDRFTAQWRDDLRRELG